MVLKFGVISVGTQCNTLIPPVEAKEIACETCDLKLRVWTWIEAIGIESTRFTSPSADSPALSNSNLFLPFPSFPSHHPPLLHSPWEFVMMQLFCWRMNSSECCIIYCDNINETQGSSDSRILTRDGGLAAWGQALMGVRPRTEPLVRFRDKALKNGTRRCQKTLNVLLSGSIKTERTTTLRPFLYLTYIGTF